MRRLIPALVILALFACQNERRAASARMSASAPMPQAPPSQPQLAAVKAAELPRMIIRSANVSMIVGDTAASIEKITAAAESAGGYVSDSKVWREGEQLRGAITLRIPADRLSAALTLIRKLAVRIQSETIGTQEVTQEYVDLQSQLRNLEAAEIELRALMSTIRQNSRKASEVLEMYQQLSTIRSQIEQIKGRIRYLSQMTALATVQVELIPDAIAKPVVEPGWQPMVIVKNASRALVEALETFAAVTIWLGIYVLPVVALLMLIAFGVWRVITVAWKTRRSPSL